MKTKFKLDFKLTVRGLVFLLLVAPSGLHLLSAGSLWREAVTDERGMFADKRARRVGDILTVVLINEGVILTDENKSVRGATNNSKPGLGTNLLNQFIAGITSKERSSRLDQARSTYDPKFPANLLPRDTTEVPKILSPDQGGISTTTGDTLKYDRRLRSEIAVQVIDVLPNGNLVIEGQRMISFGAERMFASMRGIARPYDVTAQNTVPSTLVADVRIDYIPEGSYSFMGKQGWLQRIDQKISPW